MPAPLADVLFLDTTLAAILGVLIAAAWVLGLIDVIARRPELDRTKRLAWILLIVILPILGTGLYFVLRQKAPASAANSS